MIYLNRLALVKVISRPEYAHGVPSVLRNALDWHSDEYVQNLQNSPQKSIFSLNVWAKTARVADFKVGLK